jgi:hypothetical protein
MKQYGNTNISVTGTYFGTRYSIPLISVADPDPGSNAFDRWIWDLDP